MAPTDANLALASRVASRLDTCAVSVNILLWIPVWMLCGLVGAIIGDWLTR